MKKTVLAVLMTAALGMTACADQWPNGMGNKEIIGTGAGAVLGGVVGSKFGKGSGQLVGVGLGTALGAMLGNSIGKSLDKADLAYASRAEQRAYSAPLNQPISWNNPESGHSGTVVPTRDGRTSDGRYCREYKHTIYVDGQAETAVGTACKNGDGTWSTQN